MQENLRVIELHNPTIANVQNINGYSYLGTLLSGRVL